MDDIKDKDSENNLEENESLNSFEEELKELREWQNSHNPVGKGGVPSPVTRRMLNSPIFLLIVGFMILVGGIGNVSSSSWSYIILGIAYIIVGGLLIFRAIVNIFRRNKKKN